VATSVEEDSLANVASVAGDDVADDEDFHDASEGTVVEEVIDVFASPDVSLSRLKRFLNFLAISL